MQTQAGGGKESRGRDLTHILYFLTCILAANQQLGLLIFENGCSVRDLALFPVSLLMGIFVKMRSLEN